MHHGIGAPEKWAPTLESPPLLNICFSFASLYLLSCLISLYLIHLLPILINYIRLKFQVTVSGQFWGKITCKVMISDQEFLTGCNEFWGVKGGLSSHLQCSDLLAFWRSEALLPSTGLESFRKQARTGCSCVCSLRNGNSCPTDCWRKDRNHCEQESSIVRFWKWIFFARSFYFERLALRKWCYNILASVFS